MIDDASVEKCVRCGWQMGSPPLSCQNDGSPHRFPSQQAQTEALERIVGQQPKTIGWLRANGIVFDGPLGADPKNWQHVAFSIYTDLCEVDGIARSALDPDWADKLARE